MYLARISNLEVFEISIILWIVCHIHHHLITVSTCILKPECVEVNHMLESHVQKVQGFILLLSMFMFSKQELGE